ncbi:MAG: hypothetical protein RBS23_10995, partial [Mariniphaga sp.]|nr:hypothetical protein [Mariniphaga sp.]
MRTKLTYLLLTMLLLTAHRAIGQDLYEIDKVCVGAERNYRIDGEAGSTYAWLLTDPFNVITTLPETVDTVNIIWTVPTGRYHLTNIQYGTNGCDTTQLGYIDVFELPGAYAGEDLTLCSPDPLWLEDATATDYSALGWSTTGDGTFDDDTQLNPTYTFGTNDILAGTVTLTLTATGFGNVGSCPPAESAITITLNNLMAEVTTTPATCNGAPDGSATLLASGGTEPYTYNLDGDINNTGLFTDLAAGTYTYIITDDAGCETTGELTIDQPALLMATLTQINVNCFGAANGSISIVDPAGGSGNYEYRINGGTWQTELDFTALTPGDYLIEMRDVDATDCIVVLGTITITQPDILAATVTHTDNSWPGANDGTITVSDAVGGSGDYQYSLDGITWQDSPIFPNLPPGTYTVYIRDANAPDCFLDIEEVEILEGAALTAQVDYTNINCFGFDDGSITITNPQHGGGNYEYSIDGGLTWQASGSFTGLQPLTYVVMMRDADHPENEIELTTIEITEPEQLLVSVDPASGEMCINQTLALNASATGGTGNITHLWTGSGAVYLNADDIANPVFTGTLAGNYSLYYTATDENACETTSEEVVVIVNDEITPTFAEIGPLCQNSTAPELPLTS